MRIFKNPRNPLHTGACSTHLFCLLALPGALYAIVYVKVKPVMIVQIFECTSSQNVHFQDVLSVQMGHSWFGLVSEEASAAM